jgi:hypothetical protein
VTGTPKLTLNTSPSQTANYVSGTGTSTLTFDYTVVAGDTSADLDYASASALVLNGGTVKDAVANNATLDLPDPGAINSLGANKNIVIDTTAPTVTITKVNGATVTFPFSTNVASVTSIGGTCGAAAGDNGSVGVTVNGSAAAPATATCTAGAWTLTFTTAITAANTYTLAATQSDAATNTGSSGNQTLIINRTAPTVTGVSSTLANGSYSTGTVVPVTVTFNAAVTVTGVPQLTLATGTPATTAVDYSSGSGTPTLTFNYTVAAGNTSADLNYAATTSLALNGGTIRDAATNNATLTLPATNNAGSLGGSKALVIDTTAPALASAVAFNGNTLGKIDQTGGANNQDKLTFTYSDTNGIDPASIVSGWSGSGNQNVTVTFTDGGGANSDSITVPGIGTINLGASGWLTASSTQTERLSMTGTNVFVLTIINDVTTGAGTGNAASTFAWSASGGTAADDAGNLATGSATPSSQRF